jgi:mxaD protein
MNNRGEERPMTIRVVEEIEAKAADVWEYVGDFGGLARWNPFVADVDADGDGVGATRTVQAKAGGTTVEQLDAVDPAGLTLAYRVVSTDPPQPVTGMPVTISLQEIAPGRTEITWAAEPPLNNPDLDKAVTAGVSARIDALRQALGV